jgi:hypothetical protein
MKKLGVDCANVIIHPLWGIVPDSFESLEAVVRSGHFDVIYIVSRANIITRIYFLFRLWRLKFWERTCISRNNIYFCLRNRDKEAICKRFGITDFIDDRLPVLQEMQNLDHRFAFNPTKEDTEQYPDVLARSVLVRSWRELEPILLSLK